MRLQFDAKPNRPIRPIGPHASIQHLVHASRMFSHIQRYHVHMASVPIAVPLGRAHLFRPRRERRNRNLRRLGAHRFAGLRSHNGFLDSANAGFIFRAHGARECHKNNILWV